MKYQYKLNGKIMFQTDSVYEYIQYLKKQHESDAVLAHLLDRANGYVADMATATGEAFN